METKHTTLDQSPEPDRDGDTKGYNKGDETVDSNVPYDCHNHLKEETDSHAPDTGNHIPKYGDSTETHDLTSSRTPLTNLGEENHSSDAISIPNTMAHFNEKHTDDAEATWTRLSR